MTSLSLSTLTCNPRASQILRTTKVAVQQRLLSDRPRAIIDAMRQIPDRIWTPFSSPRLDGIAYTAPKRDRPGHNEDSIYVTDQAVLLADAMGGYSGAEEIPALVFQAFKKIYRENAPIDVTQLSAAIHRLILQAKNKGGVCLSTTAVYETPHGRGTNEAVQDLTLHISRVGDTRTLVFEDKGGTWIPSYEEDDAQTRHETMVAQLLEQIRNATGNQRFNLRQQLFDKKEFQERTRHLVSDAIGSWGPGVPVQTLLTLTGNALVVIGSDGIFDNMPTQEVIDIVMRTRPDDPTGAEQIAKQIQGLTDARQADALNGAKAYLEHHYDTHIPHPKLDDTALVVYKILHG